MLLLHPEQFVVGIRVFFVFSSYCSAWASSKRLNNCKTKWETFCENCCSSVNLFTDKDFNWNNSNSKFNVQNCWKWVNVSIRSEFLIISNELLPNNKVMEIMLLFGEHYSFVVEKYRLSSKLAARPCFAWVAQ